MCAFGCVDIYEDIGSISNRVRPRLKRLLEYILSCVTLVVARIYRLARSLSHLFKVME